MHRTALPPHKGGAKDDQVPDAKSAQARKPFFMKGKSKDLAQGGKCRELTHIDHHGLALCYVPHGLMTAMFTQHDGSLKVVSSPFTADTLRLREVK